MQPKMYPVFVDNISEDVRTADLRSVFTRYGDVVEVTIVSDHGFVIFGNPNDALEAINKVNGQELNGNRLTVDVSKELEEYLHERDNKYSSEHRGNVRSRDNYERDNYRGRGRERGRRGWVHRGGRGRGFRGRGARRGYGRFSPNSRNDGRSRSPGEKYYYHNEERSPKSRRYSMGDENRRSYSPMVKRYPPPEDDKRYHHYKGSRGGRGKAKPSPPRRGQNIFPSRESGSRSPRRSSRSRTRSPSRYDRSYRSGSSKMRSRSSRSRSRSNSPGKSRLASEIIKHPRQSMDVPHDSNKGSKMDSFGFFTASNFVETKLESKEKSPARPLPPTSPITSTSANDTTSTSVTNEDEGESENLKQRNDKIPTANIKNDKSEMKTQDDRPSEAHDDNDKSYTYSKSSPQDKQVDLREILKSKKTKDKSKGIDEAFESHPLKRRKSSSSSAVKGHNNIQIKVERESESIRTIMVGVNEKSKQVKVCEDSNDRIESDRYLKSSLPPPSSRAGMPPTFAQEIENSRAEKFDMDKCQKLFIGNLFNPVEHEDLEMLLEEFGPIKAIKRYEKHAIVTIECSKEKAEEACKTLDHNNWMDNWIRVKFNKYPFSKEEADAIRKNKQTAGQRNIDRWYAQHDDRDEITLYRDESPENTTYRDRNPSSDSVDVQEEREPKKPKLTVKTELDSKFIESFSKPEIEDSDTGNNSDIIKDSTDIMTFPDIEMKKGEESLALIEKMNRRKPSLRKIRSFRVYCATTNKNFMVDIVEVFTRFGAVKSNDWEGPCIAIDLDSTEKNAVQCIFETNKIKYKGQDLRVKFKDGTDEDSADFHEIYEDEFKNYPKDLVPMGASQVRQESTVTENKTPANKNDELPIGVLPQSSSLGAFGAPGIPDQDLLTSIIQKARENMIKHETSTNKTISNFTAPPKEPLYNAYAAIEKGPIKDDPQYLSNVTGHIHSVNNKIVLIKFQIGSGWRLAKLSPGTMYVDGKKCLGYLIKNNTFHMWPQVLKDFLYQEAVINMDVKKIYDEEEISETRELCGESVTYSTPLVWKSKVSKPTEKDITISRLKQKLAVLKGNVTSIYPKWGVIETTKGEVFFEINHVYVDNARLDKQVSLLNFIEKGDTLAVQCVNVPDYLEMSEIARSAPGFRGRTDTLKYHARLVWHLNAEVDPYSVHDSATNEFSDIECNFLTTSSTLNKPLPSDRDIIQRPRRWAGRVEEIHLPAGGVILLDENLNLKPFERYAYFHRSRVYANGSKISSSTSLNEEIVPGDRVEVDVVENMQPGVLNVNKKSNAYVASEAYWIALSVHLKSNERGVLIARSLRMEVDNLHNSTFQESIESCQKDFKVFYLFRLIKYFSLAFAQMPNDLDLSLDKSCLWFIKHFLLQKLNMKMFDPSDVIMTYFCLIPLKHMFSELNNDTGESFLNLIFLQELTVKLAFMKQIIISGIRKCGTSKRGAFK